ncbi:RNA polymerase factor sigma-54, partial [Aurantiacibacter sediminis]|nr:RNA polymerase sigma-54 factor [Aurantiacibacter sediminis]
GGGENSGFDLENREDVALSLADHLEQQVGTCAPCQHTAFIAQLDEAGYLTAKLQDVANALNVPLADVERALECVQSMDPTG